MSISYFTAASVSSAARCRSSSTVASSSERTHLGDGTQPDRGIGVRQREPRQRGAEEAAQAIVGADLGQVGWRGGAGRLLRRGIDQLHRGQAFVRGFHEHDAPVLLTDVEAVLQPAGQRGSAAGWPAGEHTFGDRFLVEEAGVVQLRQQRGESRRPASAPRAAPRQDRGEQQPEPPPAGPPPTFTCSSVRSTSSSSCCSCRT